MRVTAQGVLRNSIVNIQAHFQKLARNQEMLSSGIRVKIPSDDPVATQRILRWHKVSENNDQYLRNINIKKTWLSTTESVISSIHDLAQQAFDMANIGSNALLPQEIRASYAKPIDDALRDVIRLSNTAIDGNYLFAGNRTNTVPFSPVYAGPPTPPDTQIVSVDYNGDDGQRMIEIAEGSSAATNVLGSNDFDDDGTADSVYPALLRDAASGVDIFDTLVALRDDLTAGNINNILTLRIPELEAILDNLATNEAKIGLTVKTLTLNEDILSNEKVNVQSEIDANEKADLAQVASDISYEQTIYQAALNATGRLLGQGTLFDFLSR